MCVPCSDEAAGCGGGRKKLKGGSCRVVQGGPTKSPWAVCSEGEVSWTEEWSVRICMCSNKCLPLINAVSNKGQVNGVKWRKYSTWELASSIAWSSISKATLVNSVLYRLFIVGQRSLLMRKLEFVILHHSTDTQSENEVHLLLIHRVT